LQVFLQERVSPCDYPGKSNPFQAKMKVAIFKAIQQRAYYSHREIR